MAENQEQGVGARGELPGELYGTRTAHRRTYRRLIHVSGGGAVM